MAILVLKEFYIKGLTHPSKNSGAVIVVVTEIGRGALKRKCSNIYKACGDKNFRDELAPLIPKWCGPMPGYTALHDWIAAYRAAGAPKTLPEPETAVLKCAPAEFRRNHPLPAPTATARPAAVASRRPIARGVAHAVPARAKRTVAEVEAS